MSTMGLPYMWSLTTKGFCGQEGTSKHVAVLLGASAGPGGTPPVRVRCASMRGRGGAHLGAQVVDGHHAVARAHRHVQAQVVEPQRRQLLACAAAGNEQSRRTRWRVA